MVMVRLRKLWQSGWIFLAALVGCSSTAPVQKASQPAAVHKPFMIPEASLPMGFPQPGPVGVVILKQYPACREARVDASSTGQDSMFMSLFNHIKTNDIPMSAPVEITWDQPRPDVETKPIAMAFIYGKPTTGAPGVQGKVHVLDVPPQVVVSIGVRGGYDEDHLKPALQKLNDFLMIEPRRYQVIGPPRYLGYNSPFVPWFMRFGEVQLPVAEMKPGVTPPLATIP
jgi:hypothetical protein